MPERINQSVVQSVAEGAKQGFMELYRGAQIAKGFSQNIKAQTTKMSSSMRRAAENFWNSEAVQAMRGFFSNIYGSIKGHIDEVLGPFKEVLDVAVESVKKIAGFFKGIFAPLFRSILGIGGDDPEKEQVSWLKKIYRFFVGDAARRRKAAQRGGKEEEGGWGLFEYGILGAALVSLGALIGGFVRSLSLPFEMIIKSFKKLTFIGRIISNVGNFFNKIPILNKFTKVVGRGFDIIGNFITKFGKTITKVTTILSNIPLLGQLFKGIVKGFSKLALPLTIVLGFIDFMKGFAREEGTLFDKIKAGIQEAITGFFELPAILVGWIVDKIMNLFGVQIKGGSAAVILKGLKDFIGFTLDAIAMTFKGIYLILKGLWDVIHSNTAKNLVNKSVGFIKMVISGLWGAFMKYTPVGWIITGLRELWKWLNQPGEGGEKSVIQKALEGVKKVGEAIGGLFDRIWSAIKEKLSKIPIIGKYFDEKSFDDLRKKAKAIGEQKSDEIDVIKEREARKRREQRREEELNRQKQLESAEDLARKINDSTKTSKDTNVAIMNIINGNQQRVDEGTYKDDDQNMLLSMLTSGVLQ